MTALYIIGIIVGLGIIIGLGYYLWDVSLEKYDYNIFNWGNIIRGVIALICLWFALVMVESEDGSSIVWLITSGIMWLWTFIATMIRTNFFIALFSLIYQFFAAFFILKLLNKVFKG